MTMTTTTTATAAAPMAMATSVGTLRGDADADAARGGGTVSEGASRYLAEAAHGAAGVADAAPVTTPASAAMTDMATAMAIPSPPSIPRAHVSETGIPMPMPLPPPARAEGVSGASLLVALRDNAWTVAVVFVACVVAFHPRVVDATYDWLPASLGAYDPFVRAAVVAAATIVAAAYLGSPR